MDDGVVDQVLARALEVAPLAVVAPDAYLERLVGWELVRLDASEDVRSHGGVVGVQQFEDAGDRIEVRDHAEQAGGGGVRVTPRTVGVEHRDDLGGVVEQRSQQSLGEAVGLTLVRVVRLAFVRLAVVGLAVVGLTAIRLTAVWLAPGIGVLAVECGDGNLRRRFRF